MINFVPVLSYANTRLTAERQHHNSERFLVFCFPWPLCRDVAQLETSGALPARALVVRVETLQPPMYLRAVEADTADPSRGHSAENSRGQRWITQSKDSLLPRACKTYNIASLLPAKTQAEGEKHR